MSWCGKRLINTSDCEYRVGDVYEKLTGGKVVIVAKVCRGCGNGFMTLNEYSDHIDECLQKRAAIGRLSG